jgi:hypothetical protein
VINLLINASAVSCALLAMAIHRRHDGCALFLLAAAWVLVGVALNTWSVK